MAAHESNVQLPKAHEPTCRILEDRPQPMLPHTHPGLQPGGRSFAGLTSEEVEQTVAAEACEPPHGQRLRR